MPFNGMQRESLKNWGWHEESDGSWSIDVDGHTYYLFSDEDDLFVITTNAEQFDVSHSLEELMTDFWL